MARHVPPHAPCIVGFSGGVDSSALLHILHTIGIRCHAVHVDHGWREESAAEASLLEQRTKALGIPFSCFRLPPCPQGDNPEDWSRRERMACFSSVADRLGIRIVLLAHQADDQEEVVLKRVLEGASLHTFRGMRPVDARGELTIVRPLLSIRREELLGYLHARAIPYLTDPSNADSRYLRARMRETIFPLLRASFGKEFGDSLLRVAREALELDHYLHEECARRFALYEGRGVAFGIAQEEGSYPFLVRSLIDRVRTRAVLPSLSRQQVERAVETFCGSAPGVRRFFIGEGGMVVEKGLAAAFSTKPHLITPTSFTEPAGTSIMGPWEICWRPSLVSGAESGGWKELFSGAAVMLEIPLFPFTLCPSSDRLLRRVRKQRPRCSCLRPYVPSIVQRAISDGDFQAIQLVADPLTGYTIPLPTGSPCCAVTIKWSREQPSRNLYSMLGSR